MTRIVSSLAEVSADYDAVFCDLWGCVHDGLEALPEAVSALKTYRDSGGIVVLLTNAPRPRASVAEQIARIGVPEDAWDTIATSGDAARLAMFTGAVGRRVFFIGEDRDDSFFEPLGVVSDPVEIERVPLDRADGIVCTGPFDAHADPSDLRPVLLEAKTRGLTLLNANPDIVVDRGETREWCGGAVARLYEEMGGRTLNLGKPHPPVYDLARRRLAEVAQDIDGDRILAIGDGIQTDIKGAQGEGIDSLFISGGLARLETGTSDQPDPKALEAFLSREMVTPTYTIGQLR